MCVGLYVQKILSSSGMSMHFSGIWSLRIHGGEENVKQDNIKLFLIMQLEDLKKSDEVNSADFLKVIDDLTNLTDPNREPIDKPPIEDIRNIVDDVTEVFEKKDTVTQIEAEVKFVLDFLVTRLQRFWPRPSV